MNIDYYRSLGWLFMLLAAFFALGLAAPFARRFYPRSPSFLRRLAAPLIFSGLAVSCFMEIGCDALIFVVLLGLTLITIHRWKCRNDKSAVNNSPEHLTPITVSVPLSRLTRWAARLIF